MVGPFLDKNCLFDSKIHDLKWFQDIDLDLSQKWIFLKKWIFCKLLYLTGLGQKLSGGS